MKKIVFALLLVLSVLYAVIASIRKLLGLDKKVKRSKGVQIVPENESDENSGQAVNLQVQSQVTSQSVQESVSQEQWQTGYNGYNAQRVPVQSEVPRYFRVKQNPSYVMAEYSDRYEL